MFTKTTVKGVLFFPMENNFKPKPYTY